MALTYQPDHITARQSNILLYEMKAGTPLGKTINVLFNLYCYEGKVLAAGSINLIDIPLKKMAGLAGISEEELWDSLDFLHQNGIIIICRLVFR